MIYPIDTKAHYQSLVEQYRARIPADLKDILLSNDEDEISELAFAIKRLRAKEEERYYVTEIQRKHGIALRPNESVKKTMIRVRLDILRRRRSGDDEELLMDINDPLPTDPLE